MFVVVALCNVTKLAVVDTGNTTLRRVHDPHGRPMQGGQTGLFSMTDLVVATQFNRLPKDSYIMDERVCWPDDVTCRVCSNRIENQFSFFLQFAHYFKANFL